MMTKSLSSQSCLMTFLRGMYNPYINFLSRPKGHVIFCSYDRVESVNDKVTAWERVVAQFPEGQRSLSQVKERWTRVLKVRLLEAEMDPEQTWTYRWVMTRN